MKIEPGRIYSLAKSSDSPYCLATVVRAYDTGEYHILVLYRPKRYTASSDDEENVFLPTDDCLYSVLEKQGRLELLLPFLEHLAVSQSYYDTCDHFNLSYAPVPQALYYRSPLVPVSSEAFSRKELLPYAKAFNIPNFINKAPAPITFL